MKAKKLLAFLLVIAMVASLVPMAFAAEAKVEFWDLRNTENVSKEELAITVDGEATKVTRYNGHYYDKDEKGTLTVGPGKYGPGGDRDDCQLSIYVPEGADKNSAVMFLIENGSWAQTGFKEVIAEGQAFDSTKNDRVALALAHDMVVVSYGARCRGSVDAEGNYIHAPQMVVDTKAAIRYVKYNIGLGTIPGDADKVIISGHSGGGALTAIIAASGNSADFDEYLVNAAPATDDVLAIMSSAPITDLAYADFAYEWTFGDYRDELPDFLSYKEKGCDMELSAALAARYVPYVESMFGLSEEEYTAKIEEIFAASVQHELDLAEEFQFGEIRPESDERGLFTLDDKGNVASFDLEAYTEWLVKNASQGAYPGNEMKGVIAFNGEKVDGGYMRNENNLWGAADQVASVAYEELWDKANLEAMGIDAYESWDKFWAAEGEMLAKQMKSVSVMPYLTGTDDAWYLEGVKTAEESDVAPYWFIRHGMGDADTSYATVVSLMLAVEEKAEDVNAYFGWERSHNGGGNTYYLEFFQWLEDKGVFAAEKEEKFADVAADAWYADEVAYVVAEGLMNGVGDNKFAPSGTASRAMIVTVLYRLAGSPEVKAETMFADLTADWYKDAVAWAYAEGITVGLTETEFAPDKSVTRQELATFLYRFAEADKAEAELDKYADADQIAAWAVEAMAWANAEGLIIGRTEDTLAPAYTTTRAELATILMRYTA